VARQYLFIVAKKTSRVDIRDVTAFFRHISERWTGDRFTFPDLYDHRPRLQRHGLNEGSSWWSLAGPPRRSLPRSCPRHNPPDGFDSRASPAGGRRRERPAGPGQAAGEIERDLEQFVSALRRTQG